MQEFSKYHGMPILILIWGLVSFPGNQVPKYRTVPKLACESSTSSHATMEEELVMFEVGQSSYKGVTGKPMKKLLAEEMSKETVAKKKSPSVVAKLMGLDGLPSPKAAHRQKRRLWEKYTKRTASVGADRNEKPCDNKSSRKDSVGKYGFKDVYEDPEASHVANRRKSSKQSAKPKISKQELALMQRKCEEIQRESDEIRRQILRRDSNPELMKKFLQQPDSLFVKHVHDQQGLPSSSHCSHIAVLKPPNSVKCEANANGWKAERETSSESDMGSYRRHDDELLEYCGRGSHILRSSKLRIKAKEDVKEETEIPPRRIIVLKPSLGETGNAIKYVSSPDDLRKQDVAINIREAGSCAEKGVFDETRSSSRKCREARESAKEITRQMRDSFGPFGGVRICMENSGVRGYAGDESSYNMSESDTELVMTLTSRNSFDWYDHNKPPRSGEAGSSVSREAKKRMSERWKMTHGYKDVRGVEKGSTLGEMLSTPDRQMRSENLDAVKGLDGASDGFARGAEWDTPMGISSRDGWKDGYLRSRRRSGSVPPSFGSRRHKSSEHLEVLADERLLIHREAINRDRSKAVKEQRWRESKNLRSNNKKFHPSQHRYAFTNKSIDCEPKIISSQKLIELNFENEDLPEEQPLLSQTPDGISSTASVDAMGNTDIVMSSESSNELLPLLSTCTLEDGNSSALHQHVSISQEPSNENPEENSVSLQFPGPQLQTSDISKEADHNSPVSVLEVPSIEDASPGSDCFERVTADLHELRMHLQQLKMESEENYVVPTFISADKEAEPVVPFGEQGLVGSDCWESSYFVDLLVESGLYCTDPGSFISNCYSADCPLDPSLFDRLEMKYSDETTGPRPERKLLYDRINMSLLEIYQSVMDKCPWVKPVKIGAGMMWQILGVEDQLQKLLEIHEKEANFVLSDKVLDKQLSWCGSRDDVDAIGKEIEELLVDDLITEVLNM